MPGRQAHPREKVPTPQRGTWRLSIGGAGACHNSDAMGSMPVQLVVEFAITAFAGVLMVRYGLAARMLERQATRCRDCGGVVGRTCRCHRDD